MSCPQTLLTTICHDYNKNYDFCLQNEKFLKHVKKLFNSSSHVDRLKLYTNLAICRLKKQL